MSQSFSHLLRNEPTPLPERECYYRYTDRLVSQGYTDQFDNYTSTGSALEVGLEAWEVEKHTPKGVRLSCKTLVLHKSYKKFACATLEEARASYIARKRRQYNIHSTRAAQAKVCLDAAERGDLPTKPWKMERVKSKSIVEEVT